MAESAPRAALPSTLYRAVVLESYSSKLVVKELPIPEPQNGEVLVRVEASPINPSDIAFLSGHYSSAKKPPTTPGFEGSGVVVRSGGGMMGWLNMGKRVAFSPKQTSETGCWGEYAIANASDVIPLPDNVTFETGACSIVNPLTALTMLETVQASGIRTVVSTAASSALGRMMERLFRDNGIAVINIVRRQEQVDLLKREGAQFVLNQNDEGFDNQLKELCRERDARIAFEAIAGEMTGRIATAMPKGSTVYVYGALDLKACQIDAGQLIFADKTIKGFWLSKELREKSLIAKILLMRKLVGLLNTQLHTEVQRTFALEEINEARDFYVKNMTGGKVLIKPSQKAGQSETQKPQQQQQQQQQQQ